MKLTILGTGNAKVTKCYNTCFTLNEDKEFIVDIKLRKINFVSLWKSFKYYDKILNNFIYNKDLLNDYNTDIQKLKNEIKSINIILSCWGRIINEIW